jgi:hypothetical protein
MKARPKRLREGETLSSIIYFLIDKHPRGLTRSDIQESLKKKLGVGESTGGVNRQLKKLREAALIGWDQVTYTYTLPSDCDSKEYFIRTVETMGMTTDQGYFLSLILRRVVSKRTATEIDDHLGFRYDEEMNENIMALHSDYKMNEAKVHDDITKLISNHNSYVRLRLFKTANESFLRDLAQAASDPDDAKQLLKAYSKNLESVEYDLKDETDRIFKTRQNLIKCLNEKRLSRRMKFLIRFTLNNVRPSHVYDGLI